MKKINNNRFRGNGNAVYSLNYKFDSVSSAGKISGTALDLIKRYNELAKEAQSNGNYVEMEVFRQYAEHYRKIVTEINERKNQHREFANGQQQSAENKPASDESAEPRTTENAGEQPSEAPVEEAKPQQNTEAETEKCDTVQPANNASRRAGRTPRAFKVVEVSAKADEAASSEPHKRHYTRRKPAETPAQEA